MPFEFEELNIPGAFLVKPKIFSDNRGFFEEVYKRKIFNQVGIYSEFVQVNYSHSVHNVLRGLHFQRKPYEQAKLVWCMKGEVFDVAVDLRKNSSTFSKYVSVVLSDKNRYMLFIPKGFAHGFQVLSEEADVIYLVDNYYEPGYERGIIWNDESLGIKWPLENPILSEKDKKWPTLDALLKSGDI